MAANQIGAVVCLIISAIFLGIGLIFALLKEKGAVLISGFNTLPKEERDKYDKKSMSRDMRNSSLLWGVILIVGGGLSYFVSFYFAIIACVIWAILFLREVKLDTDKAFDKYRL